MLIPTEIAPGSSAILAVPDISYWLSTAAHYYINTPGIPASQACVWGTKENPAGNWSPYVAGANTDASGKTFVKLGWNPVYLETTSSFRNDLPKFGVRLVCDGQCTGIPCAINPSTNLVNQVTSNFAANGAGGAEFCVAVAEPGSKIHIEVLREMASQIRQQYPPCPIRFQLRPLALYMVLYLVLYFVPHQPLFPEPYHILH